MTPSPSRPRPLHPLWIVKSQQTVAEVSHDDVLAAADALRHRLTLIKQLNEVLPLAESRDIEAISQAAVLYAETARPQLAASWRWKSGR